MLAGGIRQRAVTYAWLLVVVVLTLAVVTVWRAGLAAGIVWPDVGMDRDLYLDAARRWLSGGSFYPADQLSGPFPVEGRPNGQQPILYPPTALLLLVPAAFTPAVLWWLVPLAIVAWRVVALRPSWRGWAVIALLVAWPQTVYALLAGNPGMWIAAAVALGTRWPAASAWVLLKPTLAPFALVGIRHRSWWLGLALFALASAAFLPLWPDYLTVLRNAQSGSGWLYSLPQASLPLVPVIAWVSRDITP